MTRTQWIAIAAVIVVILIVILFLVFSGDSKADTKKDDKKDTTLSVFPLKFGSYNLNEVEKLQRYLNSKGVTDCNNKPLVVDGDFGKNTECAVEKQFKVKEVSETLYKTLGL